jgi:2-(1,2-epoxy-1,2-dihydrophenyl)acetyl-CoA isomerase
MTDYKTLRIDIQDNVGIITLLRPETLNAFNAAMAVDLLRAFEVVGTDNNVRAVLLRGDGAAFCVGGDIKEFSSKMERMPADVPDMIEVLNAAITTLQNLPKPVLASVHGAVAGVGVSLMLACDLAIAGESTQFLLAYTKIGLTPDGGASYFLPRIIGQRRAMQMALLPEKIGSAQALDWGLINWVAKDSELEKTTHELLNRLANGPTIAFARTKQLINKTWHRNIDDQLQAEMHAFTECTISKDFRLGVEAFINKKTPVFNGD